MADVRQLLRAERANRRLTHPHASYTKDGKLLCNLCELPIKSEAQWQSHLHSTQHLLRSQRAEDVRSTGAKKRKAESPSLDTGVEERKRARPSEQELSAEEQEEQSRSAKIAKIDTPAEEQNPETKVEAPSTASQPLIDIDDAELAAFERELADLERESIQNQTARTVVSSALNAEATITAAPMTAEELAAQTNEDRSTQRVRRDAELEAEKEDATRVLEDEFEEMQELEERVRKLREKREALRAPRDGEDATSGDVNDSAEREVNGGAQEDTDDPKNENGNDIDEQNDDDDDDDYDDPWGFGGS